MKRSLKMWRPRYFDIGVNFSDPMFRGCYNGSTTPKHPADIDKVVARAALFNVDRMLITASTIQESREHFQLIEKYPQFHSTVGVHPCSVALEFYDENELKLDVDAKLLELKQLAIDGWERNVVRAFGEIGLDYDRLHYSTKEQQVAMFRRQLEVVAELKDLQMPLFLHMRSACDDFVDIIKPFLDRGDIKRGNGVVHSFTGTAEELQKLLELGFYIGVNGCSLRNPENLAVARQVPRDRLMIETDAPWCEIRKSHASYKYITKYPNVFYPQQEDLELDPKIKMDEFLPFPSIKKEHYQKLRAAQGPDERALGPLAHPLFKSRNEPVFVGYVAEIMAALYDITEEEDIRKFVDEVYNNSCKVFG